MLQPVLFADERPLRTGPVEVTYRQSSSILHKATGMLKGVDYSINPYVGCQFGCSYCYAAFFQGDEGRRAAWGTWVDVKENALTLLRRAKGVEGKIVLIGSATDPYQPIEAKLELTRSILSHLAKLRPQPSLSLITRSPLAERDTEVFRQFDDFRLHMSITTDDDEIRKVFEPGCPSIGRRLAALEAIARSGVRVAANLAPLLPTRDSGALLRRLCDMGVERLWVNTFLRSDRPFASSTGARALRLAEEMGWTSARQEREAEWIKAEWQRLRNPNEGALSSV
jgi:DNA repair photolyase